MTNEIFKPIPGFPGYEVSNMGRVKSYKGRSPRVLKLSTNEWGYRCISLFGDGKVMRKLVHRLVMLTFVGPCPEGMEVCHGSGGPGDERLDNLRYDTHSANVLEASVKIRTLTDGQAREIRQRHTVGNISPRQLSEEYNVSKSMIREVLRGITCYNLPGDERAYPSMIQRAETARTIREEYAKGGITIRELVNKYNLSTRHIQRILTGNRLSKAGGPIVEKY